MSKIAEFYAGKTILITGATGFMGKVLLERMLCTLPDIKHIYLVIRSKNGATLDERIKKLLSNKPFTFNNISQKQFDKVSAIYGDMSKIGLDFSQESLEKIINEVSIVLHLAASTRFDLSLKDSLTQNTIATKFILELCTEIKHLESVVHVSTAYCNVDVGQCEEKVYDVQGDIDDIIHLVNTNADISEKLFIAPHPNTYTYTKRLAEIIARDMGKRIPITIVRPSIVSPAWKKPIEGWVDTLYGPMGLLATGGLGILRVGLVNLDVEPDSIPVDCAINGIIAGPWFRYQQKNNEALVLNLTVIQQKKRSWRFIIDILKTLSRKYPHKRILWYPRCYNTTNYAVYCVITFLCQIIPALFFDAILILFQQKPFLMNIQKRIFNGMKLVSYFALRKFTFITAKTEVLFSNLSPKDQEIFFAINDVEMDEEYMTKCYFGVQKYLFGDDGVTPIRHFQIKILYILDILLQALLLYGLFCVIFYIFRMYV